VVSVRLTAVAVFLLSLLGFFAALPQDVWNVQAVSRAALSIVMVEGALRIDRFESDTVDKAYVDGHYYADKQPGLSLLALPAVAVAHAVVGPPGADWDLRAQVILVAATVATSCLNGALAVLLVFVLALRLGAPQRHALLGAAALALATPFMGWSATFFAHVTSGTLLIAECAILVFLLGRPRAGQAAFGAGLCFGGVAGFVPVVDVVAAPAAALIGFLGVIVASRWPRRDFAIALAGMVLGAIVGVLPLPIYNALAFGSPLTLGYAGVVGFEGMREGFFGVSLPRPEIVWELLFGLYRGLLPWSPVLVLAPLGIVHLWRGTPIQRVAAAAIVAVFLSFLAINAAYHYWHGGASTGPRHLVPVLPFLALALAAGWPRSGAGAAAAWVLLGASVLLTAIAAAGGITAPEHYAVPLLEYSVPRAFTSLLALHFIPIGAAWAGFWWLWRRQPPVAGR
jgi:hypothetical protein